jgi:hypothetical protein
MIENTQNQGEQILSLKPIEVEMNSIGDTEVLNLKPIDFEVQNVEITEEKNKKNEEKQSALAKLNILHHLRHQKRLNINIINVTQTKMNILKEKSGVFVLKSRFFINSFLVLIILYLLRLGPLICSSVYITDGYKGDIKNITGWNNTQVEEYISIPVWPSSVFSWLFSIFFLMISRFSFPKIIELLKKLSKKFKNTPEYLIQRIKSPFAVFFFVFILLIIGQLLLIFGIYSKNPYLTISSRIVFGLFEPVDNLLTLFL